MAEPKDYGTRNRPHVSINSVRKTAAYSFPSRPQNKKPLRVDYAAHANALNSQLTTALGELPESVADPRVGVEGLKLGKIVEIETLAPAEGSRTKAAKVPPTIEFPAKDIVVLRSTRNDDRSESALLFVPDEARTYLRNRIEEYGRDVGDARRQHLDRFEKVEAVRSVDVGALFVGPVSKPDRDDAEVVWWEVWTRTPVVAAESLVELARRELLDVHSDRLVFPETTVLFIYASIGRLKEFAARVPGAITEIRRSTGTIEPFLERTGGVEQEDWVGELAARVTSPAGNSPVICVLDTGVSAAHPLLAPGLHGHWAYDQAWGTNDHAPYGGHGTALVSLALYGDLAPLMEDTRQIFLTHGAESMKLLPPTGFPPTKPPNYGVVTQGAVGLVETEREGVHRSFCLASSTCDFPANQPSSWSGAIDQIASGSMPGDGVDGQLAIHSPKRLLLVATGNVQGGMIADVMASQALEDPAQSWNALTIGGFTTKERAPPNPPRRVPVVRANHRSPFSRGSQSLPDDLTPIKPEVLFEAGNMVCDDTGLCDWHPSVSLLAAGSDVVREPLVPIWATSAAAGMAGHFIGRLQSALPDRWPETFRALTVDSAQWPQPIRKQLIGRGAHWKSQPKGKMQRILREVGYGVPEVERAVFSARNDVTLVAEAEIQPYAQGPDGRTAVFNEMHFYQLPWPKAALEQLENEIVMMKITLSYFVEPNLSGKAATRPETYRSFGLRFEVKKRSETDMHFRSRLTASQASEESTPTAEKSCWLLGPKSIQAGSLHCDVWRGRAIDLAGHDAIAVYPVGGWWKSHVGQRRCNDRGRYSLVISISAASHSVDLYAEVVNLIEVRGIPVAVG